jgi:hypothetical protein
LSSIRGITGAPKKTVIPFKEARWLRSKRCTKRW